MPCFKGIKKAVAILSTESNFGISPMFGSLAQMIQRSVLLSLSPCLCFGQDFIIEISIADWRNAGSDANTNGAQISLRAVFFYPKLKANKTT
jgi:hypothetical protein